MTAAARWILLTDGSCSPEHVLFRAPDQRAPTALPDLRHAQAGARDNRRGHTIGLAHHELRGSRELVGDRDGGADEPLTVGIGAAAIIGDRNEPGDTDRHVHLPFTPGAPEGV